MNVGTGAAAASTTKVDFFSFGEVLVPTPGIPAGGFFEFTVEFPPGCFNANCEFEIIVDSENVVPESDENNNVGADVCIG